MSMIEDYALIPRKGRKIVVPVVGETAVIVDTIGATTPESYYIYSDDGQRRRRVTRTGPKLTISDGNHWMEADSRCPRRIVYTEDGEEVEAPPEMNGLRISNGYRWLPSVLTVKEERATERPEPEGAEVAKEEGEEGGQETGGELTEEEEVEEEKEDKEEEGQESLVLLRTLAHDHSPLETSQDQNFTVLAENFCYADTPLRRHYFFEGDTCMATSVIGKPFQQNNMDTFLLSTVHPPVIRDPYSFYHPKRQHLVFNDEGEVLFGVVVVGNDPYQEMRQFGYNAPEEIDSTEDTKKVDDERAEEQREVAGKIVTELVIKSSTEEFYHKDQHLVAEIYAPESLAAEVTEEMEGTDYEKGRADEKKEEIEATHTEDMEIKTEDERTCFEKGGTGEEIQNIQSEDEVMETEPEDEDVEAEEIEGTYFENGGTEEEIENIQREDEAMETEPEDEGVEAEEIEGTDLETGGAEERQEEMEDTQTEDIEMKKEDDRTDFEKREAEVEIVDIESEDENVEEETVDDDVKDPDYKPNEAEDRQEIVDGETKTAMDTPVPAKPKQGFVTDRKKKAAPRKRAQTSANPRKTTQCTYCGSWQVNTPRHIRGCHADQAVPKKTSKAIKKACPMENCSGATTRMDIHLQRQHKLQKDDPQYTLLLASAQEYVSDREEPKDYLDIVLEEYGDSLRHRKSGKQRTTRTVEKHSQGVRMFLKCLNKKAIEQLPDIGKKDGVIDTYLAEKYKPKTLMDYLGYLCSFLQFLAGSKRLLTVLQLEANDVTTIKHSMKNISKSLEADERREAVERSIEGKNVLDVDAQMLGQYLSGVRPAEAKKLLEGDTFSTKTSVSIRDALATQLLLQNAKRAGDICSIYVDDVRRADLPEDGTETEIFIHEHKEVKSGKTSSILVARDLLQQLKTYAEKVRPSTEAKYLFTTFLGKGKGGKISESTMSKLVDREWKRHGKDTDLPKLTATKARKVAVSSFREQGASREEQETLARQMAHNVTTADKYYDKGLQTEKRQNVLGKLRSHYKAAAQPEASGSSGRRAAVEREKDWVELAKRQTRKELNLSSSDEEISE